MRRPRRQAVAPDGTRLAWSSAGAGDPPVLLTDGIGCAGYIWRRLHPALARERRVLHWNYRGHGMSGPPPDPERATLAECVSDLFTVLDAARADRAVLAGHSMGVQVVLEAHRRAPERVAALLLVCGAPGRPLDTFHDSALLRGVIPYAIAAVERWPRIVRAGFRAVVTADVAVDYALRFEVNRALLRREDLLPYFADLARVDPGLFVHLLASAGEHDTLEHLPSVRVPTLVVAGEHDSFTPMRLSSAMHERIPGSELLVLPGGTHVGPLEHPELLADGILAFLATHGLLPPASRRRGRARRAAAVAARRPRSRPRPPR